MYRLQQLSWQQLTFFLALVFFLLVMRWSIIDHSPAEWDESMYLVQATMHHQALVNYGIIAYVKSIFANGWGRVPLLTVLVEPSFLLIGPKLEAAVIFMGLLFFPLAWAFYTICTSIDETTIGKKAGFISFFLFGIYPLTTYLSNCFFVEFLLVTLVLVTYALSIKYFLTQKNTYLWLIGFSIALGMLTKVTFPAFLFPVVVLCVVQLIKKEKTSNKLKALFIVLGIICVFSGPYYLINSKSIIETTCYLSSAKLASLYDFLPPMTLDAIGEYWHHLFFHPIMVIIGGGGVFLIFHQFYLKKNKFRKFVFLIAIISFLIVFLLATFGNIKDLRYIYPAMPILFILSSFGLALVLNNCISVIVFLTACFPTLVVYIASQGCLTPLIDKYVPSLFSIDQPWAPDSRQWLIDSTVAEIVSLMEKKNLPLSLLVLGGNRYYHINLFRYYLLLQKKELNFNVLPYYERQLTLSESISYIKKNNVPAVLFKTGENYPPFSYRLTPEIVEDLHHNNNYEFRWLSAKQPDGSQFGLFLLKK